MNATNEEMNTAELRRFNLLPAVDIQIALYNWRMRTATAWQRKIVYFEYRRQLDAQIKKGKRSVLAESGF